jgi:hypothetical protein
MTKERSRTLKRCEANVKIKQKKNQKGSGYLVSLRKPQMSTPQSRCGAGSHLLCYLLTWVSRVSLRAQSLRDLSRKEVEIIGYFQLQSQHHGGYLSMSNVSEGLV